MMRDEDYEDRSEPITVYFDDVLQETEKAYLLQTDTGDVWVPKSQVESPRPVKLVKGCGEGHLDVPKWLAEREGWE